LVDRQVPQSSQTTGRHCHARPVSIAARVWLLYCCVFRVSRRLVCVSRCHAISQWHDLTLTLAPHLNISHAYEMGWSKWARIESRGYD